MVAGLAHRPQDRDRARRRVEAHAVCEPAIACRIVRQDDGDSPLAHRGRLQARPGRSQIGREGDPVGNRSMADEVDLGERAPLAHRLEGYRSCEHPAVDLGQGHAHREVTRREARHPVLPRLETAARQHDLEDRHVRQAQGIGLGAQREPRDVENDRRWQCRDQSLDQRAGTRVLEAGRKKPDGPMAARLELGQEGVDRQEVARLDQRPVEDDKGEGAAIGPKVVEREGPATLPVEPRSQQRGRLQPRQRVADQRGRVAQTLFRIGDAALAEVAPEPSAGLRLERAPVVELGVRSVVAREHGQGDRVAADRRRPPAPGHSSSSRGRPADGARRGVPEPPRARRECRPRADAEGA